MQIEVRPKPEMSVLLVGSPPVQGLALAYLLSKAGIKTAFLSAGSTEASVQHNLTPGHWPELGQGYARKLRLGYAHNLNLWLMQGRWQWVHIFAANVSRLDERIEKIASTSRRLGLYISLNVTIGGLNHNRLQQGILELLPLSTYVGFAESDALELFHSSDLADVEFKLRKQGFRGVGVTIRKPCDRIYHVKTNQTIHGTLPGNLHGEAEWLGDLIQLQIKRASVLL